MIQFIFIYLFDYVKIINLANQKKYPMLIRFHKWILQIHFQCFMR